VTADTTVGAVREVRGSDLDGWDAAAVDAPGGHVFQSRAYGAFQTTLGWRVRYLRFDDGFPVLALQRRWPWIGGWSAYVPRGPVPTDASADITAERLIAVGRWLAERGTAVVAADPEVAAGSTFAAQVAEAGFHAIEELQPSRHRMRIPLAARSEDDVWKGIAKSTRQRIRQAEGSGVVIDGCDAAPADAELDEFYDLLRATGDRRGFSFASRTEFVGWWDVALAAGHLVYLAARESSDRTTIAGLLLYRHGRRLSTVHSADVASLRSEHPGVLHLLRWRAIQEAIAEACDEMDLGGVDVAGARRVPAKGEEMYGLYEHKRSFGAEWVELAGAQERVGDPLRYAAGRVTTRLSREIARRRPGGGA
jgi:hypothetical protein